MPRARDRRAPAVGRPAVVLIGRAGCHLCQEARDVVTAVTGELGLSFTERDVDDDPALQAAYTTLVPVLLIDGAEHARWRVEEQALRVALAPYTPSSA